jgi:hypothetical protein
MKILNTLAFTLLLTGCATVPVERHFPEAPQELMAKCGNLQTIDKQQVVFSEFLKTVTANYTQYYTCVKLLDGWQVWYVQQKENFDSVDKK